MNSVRSIWINGEPIAAPAHARVVYLEGKRHALVAIPSWRIMLLTESGNIDAPDDKTNESLLSKYFPGLTTRAVTVPARTRR